ncbi:MAG: hypothetical protein WCW30_03485, partial [Candidatus Gracilibacteria bacterium]
ILGAIISLIGFLIISPCTTQGVEKEGNNIETYFQAQGFNVVEYPCVLGESTEEALKEVQENKWYPLNLEEWGSTENLQQIEIQFVGEGDMQNRTIVIAVVLEDYNEVETSIATLNEGDDFTLILEPPFSDQNYQWKWTQTPSTGENKENITLKKEYKKFNLNAFCLVTALDAGGETSEVLLQNAIDEELDFIILGNQSIAQKFNVAFEATSTLEKPGNFTLIDPDHFTYINDEKGIAQFGNCTNESFYNYPGESENALVKQWICLGEDANLQKILFISPDFFLVPSAERTMALGNSQAIGIYINGINNQGSKASREGQFDFITLTQGMIFLGGLIPLFFLGLVIFFLKIFIKEKPQKFTWSCVWILLGFGLMMEVLYFLKIEGIPVSLFRIYFGLYWVSSLVLVARGRIYLLAPFQKNTIGQYLQHNVEELTKWTGRLFVGSGILWLYLFFFLKEGQWLPLVGLYLGFFGLLLSRPIPNIFNEYKEPFGKIILWSLKVLPVVFIVLWAFSRLYATFTSDTLFYWAAYKWDTAQEIILTDRGGNALQAYYGGKDAEILSFSDALITFDSRNGSFPTQQVKVSMTLNAGQEMDFQLLNRNTSQEENALFYIPHLNELSLIYHDKKNGMAIYRYPNSKTFSASVADTDFKTFIKNHIFEENTIANFSLQQNSSLKTSFLEEGEEIPSGNQTQWDVPLAGNQKYKFYTEVMDETFSMDLHIKKFPNSALGGEFLQMTLFDSSGNLITQEQEEINYGFYDQIQNQTFSFKMDHLNSGLYEVVIEGIPGEVTYLNSSVSVAYEINSITVNSPFWVLDSDELQGAEPGALEGERSPFSTQVTDHVTSATKYILIEDSVLESIEIEEKEGDLILSKIFDIGGSTMLQWTLSPHNGEKEFWWKLKNITLEFL